MLVEWERTERQAVADALATLAAHRHKIAGLVLNKMPIEWYRLYDSGRYLDYYGYGREFPHGAERRAAS
jgi:hypothetical protein